MFIHSPFFLFEIATLALMLMMLHWLRRLVGIIPIYLMTGLFFIFGQLTMLPAFNQCFSNAGNTNQTPYLLFILPVIIIYLIIYEDSGTLEAQRFIFSILIHIIGFLYITRLLLGHSQREIMQIIPNLAELIDIQNFYSPFLTLTATHVLLFLLLPITYQYMSNWHLPFFICLFANAWLFMLGSGLAHRCVLPTHNGESSFSFAWLTWNLSILLISILGHIYIKLTSAPLDERRRPLKMLSTLFQHLQSSSKMRQSVEEWAGRYQIVFDNTIEMIFLLNKSGAVVNANRSAINTLGPILYTSGYILTSLITNANGNHFNWQEVWDVLIMGKLALKAPTAFNNMKLNIPNRESIDVDFTLYPVRFNDMDIALLIMRDMTQEKRIAKERKQLEEQLMHSQRLEAVGVLAGGVAHDFNNLLLGIQTSSEMLSQQPLNDKCRFFLNNIDNATKRAADLVMKLLYFARKGKYEVKLLDLGNIVQEAADLFNVGLKDITFRLLAEPQPMMIQGDSTQLQQVILNILLNAKDSLLPGDKSTRKITLRLDNAQEDMPSWEKHPQTARNAKDYIVLRIKDTGKGMDSETLSHIFEPFFTTKGTRGNGLGMSMAYGCITHHKGWINVDSTPNNGTEFAIFLPKAKL